MEHAQSQQSSALPAVQRIAAIAVEAGWSDEEGFIAAMLMVAAGVTVSEAGEMFLDCRRRVQ
jgi:hypothetical protein